MIIISSDGKRLIDVGTGAILKSVYSTASKRLGRRVDKMQDALVFLETGICEAPNSLKTARQFNLLRDEFARLSPDKAIWDIDDLTKESPWSKGLSPVITSCANLYTTADGKDLLFEIVSILVYGSITQHRITFA